jgi:hypothetical protein
MTRTLLGVCAGVWALLLAGCASTNVAGLIGFKGDANERLIDGSLEVVAQNTRDKLVNTLKLKADLSKKGDVIYIYSATPKPIESRFTLVLTREKTGQVERTRIKLQCQDKIDNAFTSALLARLEFVSGQ